MTETPNKEALQAELDAMNAEWDAITAKRKAWMDAHMADFAKYPIGTQLYKVSRGKGELHGSIGRVIAYFRVGDEDPRFDREMDVYYDTDTGDNTSRLYNDVESAAERVVRLRREADSLDTLRAHTFAPDTRNG